MQKTWLKGKGFTIIELIIVIAIIAILTAITAVIYTGVQTRSRVTKAENDIKAVQKLVEAYKARNGTYPVTTAGAFNPDWGTSTAWSDSGCPAGVKKVDWVPGLSSPLPQSQPTTWGVGGYLGCYIYTSNGTVYVLSAWNMLKDPQKETMYRRVGFREMDPSHWYAMFYLCNYPGIDGVLSGSYNANMDYYKHSYTVSNMTASDCAETPPSGA
jgi:prepilin-type N-terminal cleavage/methylation domain-containing protein